MKTLPGCGPTAEVAVSFASLAFSSGYQQAILSSVRVVFSDAQKEDI